MKGRLATAKANEPVASHNVPLGRDGGTAIRTPIGGHVIRRLFDNKGSRVPLRAIARWLGLSALSIVGLELLYLAAFNVLLPARLVSFAKRYELDLRITGFRTLYPGDLGASAVRLSGPRSSFDIATKAVRGRVKIWALLGGSLDLEWLRVASVDLKVQKPSALRVAFSGASEVEPLYGSTREAALADFPAMDRIRVDRATVGFRTLALGGLELAGLIEVRLTNASLADGGVGMDAFAHLAHVNAARRAANDFIPLTALDGDVAMKLSPRDVGVTGESNEPGLVARTSLRFKAANLGAMLGDGPNIEVSDAHLAVELQMSRGVAQPGSFVDLHSAELRSPPVRFAASGVLFREVRLHMELSSRAHVLEDLAGSLSLRSSDVAFSFQGTPQHFSLASQATIEELNPSSLSLALAAGEARLERFDPRARQSDSQQPLKLVLTLGRASWSRKDSFALSGAVVANGGDTSALLDLGRPDPGARWMLSEVVGSPFTLQLQVRLQPDRIALEDIALTTAGDTASGAMFVRDDGPHGAFLVRRGKLDIGVEVEPDTMKLDLAANRDWLDRSVARLASAGAP